MAKTNNRANAAKYAFLKSQTQEQETETAETTTITTGRTTKPVKAEIPKPQQEEQQTAPVNDEVVNVKKTSQPKKTVSIPLDLYNKCKILTMLPGSDFQGYKINEVVIEAVENVVYQEKYNSIFEQFDNMKVD